MHQSRTNTPVYILSDLAACVLLIFPASFGNLIIRMSRSIGCLIGHVWLRMQVSHWYHMQSGPYFRRDFWQTSAAYWLSLLLLYYLWSLLTESSMAQGRWAFVLFPLEWDQRHLCDSVWRDLQSKTFLWICKQLHEVSVACWRCCAGTTSRQIIFLNIKQAMINLKDMHPILYRNEIKLVLVGDVYCLFSIALFLHHTA